MSRPSQLDIFEVLLDRAEEDGGLATEIRQWIANHLVQLRILGPWESTINERTLEDARRPLGSNRGAPAMCVVSKAPDGSLVPWRGEYRGIATDSSIGSWFDLSDAARRHADRGARHHGWVCADRPLEQLCRRLRELGEWSGFVDDLETRTTPSKEYAHIYDVHGHDPIVRDCLRQLGFIPGAPQEQHA